MFFWDSCNDIDVLQRLLLMTQIAFSERPPVKFEANGHAYSYNYFLANNIYPRWSIFVKSIVKPNSNKVLNLHNTQLHMQRLGMMWREYLGFCKPNLLQ
jgi:hypothetical protein